MKDMNVEKKVEELRDAITLVNQLALALSQSFVEVKMVVREDGSNPSRVELFRAVAHVDYLK